MALFTTRPRVLVIGCEGGSARIGEGGLCYRDIVQLDVLCAEHFP